MSVALERTTLEPYDVARSEPQSPRQSRYFKIVCFVDAVPRYSLATKNGRNPKILIDALARATPHP